MDITRTIYRYTYQKVMLFEEFCPFACYQGSVGLQGIMDYLTTGIFLLEFHGLAIEVQPHHKRLTTMPVENHFRNIVRLDILPCKKFKSLLGHLRLPAVINIRFVQIVAVMTVQVAQRARRLYHQIESQRSFGVLHCLLKRDCIFKWMPHL